MTGTDAGAPTPPPPDERRAQVEKLLTDILELMGYPARLDVQDAPDRGFSVALHFTAELPPGTEPGKRSQVADNLQFLVNKMVNRPGVERRWVTLGMGAHPEPREKKAPAPPRAPAAQPPQQQQPAAPAAKQPPPAARPQKGGPAQPQAARTAEPDERSREVTEDAALAQVARALAEKSAKLGRFYALAALGADDRARVLRATDGVEGVRVHAEGEGRCRRVVYTPAKPVLLPKKSALPIDDDELDEDE